MATIHRVVLLVSHRRVAVPSAAVEQDLAAALDAALQHAREAEWLLTTGDGAATGAIRASLATVDAMLGLAVAAAPAERRSPLADARARIAALLLAADQLDEIASHVQAHRLRARAAAEGTSIATRHLHRSDASIAI